MKREGTGREALVQDGNFVSAPCKFLGFAYKTYENGFIMFRIRLHIRFLIVKQ